MRRRWLLIAVILTAPSGCDNVAWGGVDVTLRGPGGEAEDTLPAPAAEEDVPDEPGLPAGPLLLAGTREGDVGSLTVVGPVGRGTVVAFPSAADAPGYLEELSRALLARGTELTLFSEGVRVGRLTVTETDVDTGLCAPRPRVRGIVELLPGAAAAERFLALSGAGPRTRPYGGFQALAHNYNQRVASLNLASGLIQQLGIRWPTSLLEARADIRVFRRRDTPEPSIAATFLFGDRLAVGRPEPDSYALFLLGTRGPTGYGQDFVWYRESAVDGKGAPRYFDHLDWDGDGATEILLDVFGAEGRWYATLGQVDGAWTRTFEDPCGAPPTG